MTNAYAWNSAVDGVGGWPQRSLAMPRTRVVRGLKWFNFAPGLEAQAQAAVEDNFTFLPAGSRAAKKAGRTAAVNSDYMLYLRLGASELAHSGIIRPKLTGR